MPGSPIRENLNHSFSGQAVLQPPVPTAGGSGAYAEAATKPTIEELAAKERAEPGYCGRVKDFVFGRLNVGSIKFLGETDVRRVALESSIGFADRCFIYIMINPPAGQGFTSGTAEVPLVIAKFSSEDMSYPHIRALMNEEYRIYKGDVDRQGLEFVSYNPINTEFKHRVKYFSGSGVMGIKNQVSRRFFTGSPDDKLRVSGGGLAAVEVEVIKQFFFVVTGSFPFLACEPFDVEAMINDFAKKGKEPVTTKNDCLMASTSRDGNPNPKIHAVHPKKKGFLETHIPFLKTPLDFFKEKIPFSKKTSSADTELVVRRAGKEPVIEDNVGPKTHNFLKKYFNFRKTPEPENDIEANREKHTSEILDSTDKKFKKFLEILKSPFGGSKTNGPLNNNPNEEEEDEKCTMVTCCTSFFQLCQPPTASSGVNILTRFGQEDYDIYKRPFNKIPSHVLHGGF
ncbi:hypothetical protein L6452_31515 [Arctium lappa]|uniref:Uncharacterized protein n=1 Tax=Arctium lappa TaxID=4217 RepID=A0ACB8Z2X5_ARCLA|nr:hypothetical protein L6452_31515 [Arctium lappa]